MKNERPRQARGNNHPLELLIIGAGAIGGYIGGSLSRTGHTPTYLCTTRTASRLRQQGLYVGLMDDEFHDPEPRVAESLPAAFEENTFDAVLLAVKSYATGEIAAELARWKDLLPPVVCLQNGVENETMLAGVLGAQKVIAGTVTTAVARPEANRVLVERRRGIGIAAQRFEPGLIDRLLKAMNQAGLGARLYSNAAAMKWSKLLTNLIANPIAALTGLTPGQIYRHPGLFEIEMRQLQEALQVMTALGVPVIDLPGTPVRLLSAIAGWPAWISQPLLRRGIGGARGEKMPSFYVDLSTGSQRTEIDYLHGAVARFGRQVGVDAPINQILTDAVNRISRGDWDRQRFTKRPDAFLAWIHPQV